MLEFSVHVAQSGNGLTGVLHIQGPIDQGRWPLTMCRAYCLLPTLHCGFVWDLIQHQALFLQKPLSFCLAHHLSHSQAQSLLLYHAWLLDMCLHIFAREGCMQPGLPGLQSTVQVKLL